MGGGRGWQRIGSSAIQRRASSAGWPSAARQLVSCELPRGARKEQPATRICIVLRGRSMLPARPNQRRRILILAWAPPRPHTGPATAWSQTPALPLPASTYSSLRLSLTTPRISPGRQNTSRQRRPPCCTSRQRHSTCQRGRRRPQAVVGARRAVPRAAPCCWRRALLHSDPADRPTAYRLSFAAVCDPNEYPRVWPRQPAPPLILPHGHRPNTCRAEEPLAPPQLQQAAGCRDGGRRAAARAAANMLQAPRAPRAALACSACVQRRPGGCAERWGPTGRGSGSPSDGSQQRRAPRGDTRRSPASARSLTSSWSRARRRPAW
jgi:hypothetical protein